MDGFAGHAQGRFGGACEKDAEPAEGRGAGGIEIGGKERGPQGIVPEKPFAAEFGEFAADGGVEAPPIRLAALPVISGTILDPDGQPASHVLLSTRNMDPPSWAISDETGVFHLRLARMPYAAEVTLRAEHAMRFWRADFAVDMTRLDENRAKAQLAAKAGVPVSDISRMTIWGNHSATQYPDFFNAQINSRSAAEVIEDRAWFENDFIPTVQQRGAAIIKARGASSAASAASAAVDCVRSLHFPTAVDDWHSVAVCSDGSYGADTGLIVSYPIRSDGTSWEIVQGVEVNEFSRGKIDATFQELAAERDMVKDLI